MDKLEFWSLIDLSRQQSPSDQRSSLVSLLTRLERKEIVEFAVIFSNLQWSASTWHLFGAAGIAMEGHSEDGFIDFIEWLISRGEEVYERVLDDPDALVDELVGQNVPLYEGFASSIQEALRLKGEDISWTRSERELFERSGRPGLRGPRAWQDAGDLKRIFPRLAEWDDGLVL